jgi:hypothetical protein
MSTLFNQLLCGQGVVEGREWIRIANFFPSKILGFLGGDYEE